MKKMTHIAALALTLCGLAASAQAQQMRVPAEGAELNYLHMRFRWDAAPNAASDYFLEVFTDDGSMNPFLTGTPVVQELVSNAEPQTIVTSGLDWNQSYACRVLWMENTPTLRRLSTPTRRFRTKEFTQSNLDFSKLAETTLLPVPAGGGPVQPGIVIFSSVRRHSSGSHPDGHLVGVDETGKVVFHIQTEFGTYGDLRMMENGRLLAGRFDTNFPSGGGGGCGSAIVLTLDGKKTFETSTAYCFEDPQPTDHNGADLRRGTHHEVFPMPEDGPNGASFLLDLYDNRTIASYTDPFDGQSYTDMNWRGDVACEIDRHTQEVIFEVSTFDYMSLDDHLPVGHASNAGGPGNNWNHTNSIVYDEFFNQILFSNRRQSRVVALDYGTSNIAWQVGDNSIVGFGPGGTSGPWPSGATLMGDNFFSWQHAPERLANGNLVVYDNGNFTEPYDPANVLAGRQTRAIEIAFDDPVNPTTANIVWSYDCVLEDGVTPAFENFVGDADRQPNGNTLICNGFNANLQEVDSNGNLVWFLDLGPPNYFGPPQPEAGSVVYRAEKIPSLIVDTPNDVDADWDVDLLDLAQLQCEFTGPGAQNLGWPEKLSDQDGDDDIDGDDFERFNYWMTGPARTRKP